MMNTARTDAYIKLSGEKLETNQLSRSKPKIDANVLGKNIIACANIIGITPAVKIFKGKWVDWPP